MAASSVERRAVGCLVHAMRLGVQEPCLLARIHPAKMAMAKYARVMIAE